jgi:DNA polymerase III subunit beta
MKFVATQSIILKSLSLVLGGATKTGDGSMVKIIANKEDGLITLETKNTDLKIKSFFKSDIENSGEICVELVKLNEIVKKLDTSIEILFEVTNLTLLIKSGKSKFSVKGVVIANIPEVEEEHRNSFSIMSKKILSLIDKTKFAIFPDETRFNLNGILFEFKNEKNTSFLTTVSTDGHRLAFSKLEVENNENFTFPRIIIPKKATMELRKILDLTVDCDVEVKLLNKKIILSSSAFEFTSKLIDAEFPQYENVIPRENTKTATIQRKDLINLIERVSAIHAASSENGLNLIFSKNLLTIAGQNKNTGEANDEIVIETNFDESLSVNYNYVYLLEILSHISSDKVVINLKNEQTPALIEDCNIESYFYILMPMRF